MDPSPYPQGARRAVIAALLALLAALVITGAIGAARSVPEGTPVPACAANGSGAAVQPCNWHESDDNLTTSR